jgi:CopA family copper-resistance protein
MRKSLMRVFSLGLMASMSTALLPVLTFAGTYNLTVDKVLIDTGDFTKEGIGYNGKSPGPTLRFNEGEEVIINVTNNLEETTSIHWHGLILPYQMDGVPKISYPGIEPGETFTYKFPIVQTGTYWFHSHSGFQEPDGAYGSIVIDPKGRAPFRFDRDYVVQFTDKHPHSGKRIMRNLKMASDYYNRQQQTLGDFLSDVNKNGFEATVSDRLDWGSMRMMATDVEDVQGFTPLINGKGPEQNWTGIFNPKERVLLRLINSSAMTYFDVRIPGLKMTVVASDGNYVQPVTVDELRIGVAETYDVLVRPKDDKAYTIFGASMGRTAYARGTLAPRDGRSADIPEMSKRPLLTMADMGMDHSKMKKMDQSNMKGMDHSNMKGMDHSSMMGMGSKEDKFYAKGSGIAPTAANGGKFLSYVDLKAQKPLYKEREATREIELRLTGNMERYIWSINGVKYEDADPIKLQYGERVRFKFVNETMMTHPMHLHGMWSILDVGAGKWNPAKHTISVAPGTTVYSETEVDATGQWAFHCHLSYHADAGMFRKVVVEGGPKTASLTTTGKGVPQ